MILWKDGHTTVFRSALYETTSSVVVTDDCVIVVDPNWLPHEIEEIQRYVDGVKEDRAIYLLFTHSDFDHVIGYRAFPEAIVIASGAFNRKSTCEKEKIIEEIKTFDDDYYISRNYEIIYPEVDHIIDGDGTSIKIGQTKLTFFQAQGHNNDGLFMIIEPIGVFFCGDYFSDIEFPFIYFSSYEYEKTILKLDDILSHFDIKLLVTGHGNPTSNTTEMKKRQQDSLEYIVKMRDYVLSNQNKAIVQLIKDYKFSGNMKKTHHSNTLLMKKELGESDN